MSKYRYIAISIMAVIIALFSVIGIYADTIGVNNVTYGAYPIDSVVITSYYQTPEDIQMSTSSGRFSHNIVHVAGYSNSWNYYTNDMNAYGIESQETIYDPQRSPLYINAYRALPNGSEDFAIYTVDCIPHSLIAGTNNAYRMVDTDVLLGSFIYTKNDDKDMFLYYTDIYFDITFDIQYIKTNVRLTDATVDPEQPYTNVEVDYETKSKTYTYQAQNSAFSCKEVFQRLCNELSMNEVFISSCKITLEGGSWDSLIPYACLLGIGIDTSLHNGYLTSIPPYNSLEQGASLIGLEALGESLSRPVDAFFRTAIYPGITIGVVFLVLLVLALVRVAINWWAGG